MSPLQQKPILHGRDHCPGGADPIPCMIGGPGVAGDYEGTVLGLGPYAYWRLGETAGPWADTSGFGSPDNMVEHSGTTALTPDVTGALAEGDDGAVRFNYDGTGTDSAADYLHTFGSVKDFDFNGSSGTMSFAVWANIQASAATREGVVIGNLNVSVGLPHPTLGWGLRVFYPGRGVRFSRFDLSGAELYTEVGGSAADVWNFYVGTYDGAEIKLYVNAELQDTTADTTAAVTGGTEELRLGFSITDHTGLDYVYSWLYGVVDEAAVWQRALSAGEIANLYDAGASAATPAGYVLTSDGAGGTSWSAPTIEVEF